MLLSNVKPYTGSSWNRCAKCKAFTLPQFQVHVDRFTYKYYCCEQHLPCNQIVQVCKRPTIAERQASEARKDVKALLFKLLEEEGAARTSEAAQKLGLNREYLRRKVKEMAEEGSIELIGSGARGIDPWVVKREDVGSPKVTSKMIPKRGTLQSAIVRTLDSHPSTLTELAKQCGADKKTIHEVLRRLVKKGIAYRLRAKNDGRNGSRNVYFLKSDNDRAQSRLDRLETENFRNPSRNQTRILEYLRGNPANPAQLANDLFEGQQSTAFSCLSRMHDRGLLSRLRMPSDEGNAWITVYALKDEEWMLRDRRQNAFSFNQRKVLEAIREYPGLRMIDIERIAAIRSDSGFAAVKRLIDRGFVKHCPETKTYFPVTQSQELLNAG